MSTYGTKRRPRRGAPGPTFVLTNTSRSAVTPCPKRKGPGENRSGIDDSDRGGRGVGASPSAPAKAQATTAAHHEYPPPDWRVSAQRGTRAGPRSRRSTRRGRARARPARTPRAAGQRSPCPRVRAGDSPRARRTSRERPSRRRRRPQAVDRGEAPLPEGVLEHDGDDVPALLERVSRCRGAADEEVGEDEDERSRRDRARVREQELERVGTFAAGAANGAPASSRSWYSQSDWVCGGSQKARRRRRRSRDSRGSRGPRPRSPGSARWPHAARPAC